jgi:MFS family permease
MHRPGPRGAISAIFLVSGLIAGTWFGRIPAITSNLDLDKGQVGALILLLSVGSLVAFQFIGRAVTRFGSARVSWFSSSLAAVALTLLALAPNAVALGMALFASGFAIGATGVSMNAQGVIVQRHLGRPIMNSLHGCFTLGTLGGSAIGGMLARADVGPVPQFLGISVIAIAVVTAALPGLLDDDPVEGTAGSGHGLALPPKALMPLGILAFCAGLGEGSMYDWSALYVHEDLGASESTGALAFATFSLAMLIGRFSGDRIVQRIGTVNVVRVGGSIAAVGLLGGLAVNSLAAVFVGFALLGLGLSVLMPLFYGAAGTHPGIPGVRGVAAIATMGFTGLLAGPPLLGTLAEVASLRASLGIVVVLCAIMALLAGNMKTVDSRDEPAVYPEAAGEYVS